MNRGYTLIELLVVVFGLASLLVAGLVGACVVKLAFSYLF
jgi:prepilin-type N-terminal cleavage/methylation domain-containing protein